MAPLGESMHDARRRLHSFWSEDRSLTAVLVALVLLLLLPSGGGVAHALLAVVGNLLLTSLLLAGVGALAGHRALRLLCWALVWVSIAVRWMAATGLVPSL